MKKIKNKSIRQLILLIVFLSLFGMILYPIFDLIYYKLIAHSAFVYSIKDHIVEPILYGVILGLVSWTVNRKQKN